MPTKKLNLKAKNYLGDGGPSMLCQKKKKKMTSKELKTEMEYFKDKRVMVLFLPFGELIIGGTNS